MLYGLNSYLCIMLHEKQFHSAFLECLYTTAEFVIRPWLWSFGRVISLCLPTDDETKYLWSLTCFPLFLCICVSWTIPALCAFILRCTLLYFRMPYCLLKVTPNLTCEENHMYRRKYKLKTHSDDNYDRIFSVATINACLLPEFLSRFNNLSNIKNRAQKIGENIVIDQFYYQDMMNGRAYPECIKHTSSDSHISTHFPKLDFLCFQETWDRDVTKVLVNELKKVFPWILYDVGITNFSGNFFMLNSGLLFASCYPILAADFRKFTHSWTQCKFASKGLLVVKIDISHTLGKDAVGYVLNANLQSYQGRRKILDKQLDEILQWSDEFISKTIKTSDVVKFSILCGDFNFDNMSPADRELSQHKIFDVYEDEARVKSGKDKDWAIGTEMRQKYLHDPLISTPQGLAHALGDPLLRQQYIVDGNIEVSTISSICKSEPQRDPDGNLVANTDGSGGRRRIDYILYKKDSPVRVENYCYITRLARLTDHIPVCMEFSVKS